MQYMIQIPKM